jgi:hypothetical protein
VRPGKYLSFLKILELLKAIRRTYHISKHNLPLGYVSRHKFTLFSVITYKSGIALISLYPA